MKQGQVVVFIAAAGSIVVQLQGWLEAWQWFIQY